MAALPFAPVLVKPLWFFWTRGPLVPNMEVVALDTAGVEMSRQAVSGEACSVGEL